MQQARVIVSMVLGLLLGVGGCKPKNPEATQAAGGTPRQSASESDEAFPLRILQLGAETDGSRETTQLTERPVNRLAGETSPYLLLHAHNPVDWYPWGPEAFEAAQRDKKPIFLSVGYSSCYWCHVMERLVFSNAEIAKLMNEHFINIKVDREERPDVDEIYMTALQIYLALSGAGSGSGWPLSMFLTPDGKPIAGGTYFPPADDGPRPGFPKVVQTIVDAWSTRRDELDRNAETLSDLVRREMRPALSLEPAPIDRDAVVAVIQAIVQSHDPEYGGVDFSLDRPDAPKFPSPTRLALLQYEYREHAHQEAGQVLHHTLDAMALGGIRDHLGGGFHRYSTDRKWAVPHFEKMLYDNAQLADLYAEAYRLTNKSLYREAAEDIIRFVLTEMRDPGGGFHAALDAETDSIEGLYYVWSPQEVDRILGSDAALFRAAYGLNEPSAFEHGHILRLVRPLEDIAADERIPPRELALRLDDLRRKLLLVRRERPRPLKDDKVLTSWNGLMIRALANASVVFSRREYLESAERAALFVLANLRDNEGRLLRTFRSNQARLNAYLDDYAFLIEGLLALHSATHDIKWLNAARHLTDDQIKAFWDEQGKGFFFTSHEHEHLLARFKNAYDGALPSGNSVSVRNLLRLASLTGDERYREYAVRTLELFAPQMKSTPRGLANLAIAMAEFVDNHNFSSLDGRVSSKTDSASPPVAETQSGPVLPSSPTRPVETAPDAAGGDPAASTPKAVKNPAVQSARDRLSAKAFLSTTKLRSGGACRIAVVLQIEPGWHVTANPAVPNYLVPTTLNLKSRLGTRLSNVLYPKGQEFRLQTTDGQSQPGSSQQSQIPTASVYEGEVMLVGDLDVAVDAAGKTEELELQIRYQACNAELCERPKTIRFAATIPIAAKGEVVEEINSAIFDQTVRSERPQAQ